MKTDYLKGFAALCLALAATGCVDDKYDLSDIDSTIRVGVDNLVIPVNIDAIKMNSIIDLSDDDEHIKIIDGQYAYVSDGDFHSEAIEVDEFFINAFDIAPSTASINLKDLAQAPAMHAAPDVIWYYIADPKETELSLSTSGIPEEIVDVTNIYGRLVLEIEVPLDVMQPVTSKVEISELAFKLPAGLEVGDIDGKYDPATGMLTLNTMTVSTSESLVLTLPVNSFTLTSAQFDADKHAITFEQMIGVEAGMFSINTSDLKVPDLSELPAQRDITINYYLHGPNDERGFTVDAFSGKIKYAIEDVNVPDVNINDLPDVLSQPGTNLVFGNPCLFMHINNPLQQYNIYAQTGFEITAVRTEPASKQAYKCSPFTIGKDPVHADGQYNFCLSPAAAQNAEYPDAKHVAFAELSNVLSGDGLPNTLQIKLVDPCMPVQPINKFQLGHKYEAVQGTYDLIAPLQLEAGSVIRYSDTLDGWSSDDLDALTIENLDINLTVTTDIPVAINFTGYPIDVDGNRINNVSIEGAKINAKAQNQEVHVTITGEIKRLDGITFTAEALGAGGAALSPNMTITLTNVRPCAKGYYEKEL